MATEKESSCQDICANDPNFAIICSFFDRFASSCGITHPTFLELQEMIENPTEVPTELVELHVKLLRKIRKSVSAEKWEKALVKFCHSYYCSEDGWELERCGYKKCKVPIKLRILKNLLDAQFDLNVKFKNDINKLTAEELRTEPLGRDKVGQSYWCQFDSAANVRVYKEDQDEETWKLVAKDREGLVDLITQLSSGEELLGLELINEDSNSQEVEKPIIDTGQVEVSTSEENTADNTSSTDSKIEHSVKQEDNSNSGSSQQNISCINEDNNDRTSFELNLQSSTTLCKTDINETDKSCTPPKVDNKGMNLCSTDAEDVDIKELVEKDLVKSVENTKNTDSKPLISSSTTRQDVVCGETILSSTKSLESASNDLKNIDEDYSKNAHSEEINVLHQSEECKSNYITTNSTITEKTEDGSNLKHIIPKDDVTIKTNLPITSEDLTKSHTPETSNINVAEEIKQRSLFKSNISSLFKGKIGKSSSGSKLDQIFSRKLEQSNVSSVIDQSNVSSVIDQSFKSTTKLLSSNLTNKHEKELHSTIPSDNELFNKASVPIVGNEDCSVYIEPNSKRKPDETVIDEQPLKKQCVEAESNDDEVGEEIEEPVMIIMGEGLGRECDTGNPGREEDEVTTEKISNSSSDSDLKVINKQKQTSSNSQVSNFENCDEDLKLKNLDSKIDKLNNGIAENKSPENAHEKSIEEQLSDLTGESLSPKTSDLSNINCNNEKQDNVLSSKQTEKGMRRKSFECTDSVDNESVPPEAKKTKVVLDDILGCLNDNSSSDVVGNKFSSEEITKERDSNTVSNNILTKESESNSNRNTETSSNINTLEENDLVRDEDQVNEIKTSKQIIDVYKKQTIKDRTSHNPINHVTDDRNEELQHNKCKDNKINIQTDKEKDNSNLNEKLEQNCNSTKENSLSNSEQLAEISIENGSDNEEVKNIISDQHEQVEQNSLEENIVGKKKKSSNKFTSKASKKSIKNSRKKNSKRKNVFAPNTEANNTSDDKALINTGDSFTTKSVEDEILDDKENDSKKVTKDKTSDEEVKTDTVNNHSQENYNETNIEEPLSSKEDNDSSPNKKKSNQKKSPSKRRKLFTPKSRKRTNKNQIAVTEKEKATKDNDGENEENSHENASEEQNETTDKINNMENEGKEIVKGGINPMSLKSRKRRNSRKNTGTEKDSEDEISDRKDNNEVDEEEVGGKRRKIKGKRTPNKTVRKSVEEKRNTKSSSEEETQPETGNDEKEIKKTSASKKRKSPVKKSKIKEKVDGKSKTNSVQASKTKKEISEVDDDDEEHEQIIKKKKSVKVQGRHSRAFLGIDLNIDISDTSRSVRQSSRLAQIKIKEQADPKLGDENRHVTEKPSKKQKKKDGEEKLKGSQKKKKKSKKVVSEEDIQEEEPVVEKKKGRRKKKKKNPVRAFNERDPWKSSSGSSSEVEEEEEDHFEDIVDEEEDIPVTLKSDHEFSPESDIEGDEEVKPIRRARTAQKVTDPQVEEGEESKDTDDFACEKCGKKDHPEWILLCDTCDHGWHASCLRPSLMLVPEGDWHCPPCQHTVLVKRLQETLKIYDRDTKRRQNEELRRKRLAYVGISLDNVLPSGHQNVPRERETTEESSESSGSSSGSDTEGSEEPVYQLRQRRQGPTSYRFNEYDDLINSAIQDEVNEVTVINTGLLKPPAENSVISITTKVEEKKENEQVNTENVGEVISTGQDQPDVVAVAAEKPKKKEKDESGEESSEEEDDNEEEEFPSVVPKRNNVLPRPGKKKHRRLNCLDDPSDDDDGSDEDFKGSSSEEEEEEEEEYSDDSEVGRRGRSKRGHLGPVRRSSRARRSRFDKEFINDDSEESDAPRRKKTKKLWSDSDSESDDSTWGKRKKKKNYSSGRRKFQRNKKFTIEDELSESEGAKVPKKKRQRKIKYGGLDDLNVEELPARRTRGKKINYQEVLGSDTDEEIQKTKNLKRAIIDDEDEFVADKEEDKDESRSSSDEEESLDEEENEKSSEDEKDVTVKETEKVNEEEEQELKPKSDVLPMKSSPFKPSPPKIVNKEKPVGVPGRRGRPPKAMIAPPPERLISEDEQYKAIVSKVPTIEHTDRTNSEVNIAMPGNNINDHIDPAHLLTSKKILNSSIDSKFINRSPPLKIRSGVPVNAVGRKSPTLVSPSSEPSFFPVRSPNSGPIGSPPDTKFQYPLKMQRTLVPFQGGPQQFGSTRKSVNLPQGNIKIENTNEEELDDLEDEDLMDDIEEEEEEDEDDSDDDVLEEGEIPKKVARRMARMEERLQKLEDKKLAKQIKTVQPSVTIQPVSPGSAQTPAGNTPSDQKPPTTQPTQPLLRVVSPLKLMANPPSTLQSTFMHSGINPRMQMSSPPATRMSLPMRPPQPANMMGQPVLGMDEGGGKRRGRGRGKKQLAQEKSDQELMVGGGSGGSVIRGMLQQPQSYPPTHYPQQYPPPPRIPFNPQRMPRPPFHPGHHPMDPSPSGGGTISIKQEGGGHPQSAPVHIPNKPQSSGPPYHPPPHRFDSSIPRQPGYPPQGNPPPKSQYGSYPPPPATGGSYHYGNYPTPMPAREEPQVYPAQQQYNEQYGEPQPSASAPAPAPPSSKGFTEEESGGEFGGLVSYFSSQREDDIDT